MDTVVVSNDTIKVKIITQGPNDGLGSPIMPYTFVFKYHNGRLTNITKKGMAGSRSMRGGPG